MRQIVTFGIVLFVLSAVGKAQTAGFRFPEKVEAGRAFSVPTSGTGAATLYIVGPGSALERELQLGESVAFGSDDLHNAGHYVAILAADSSVQSAPFDVMASREPGKLSFLAKPSRLPVGLSDGISGVAYVFDRFGNLILESQPVSFELSDASGHVQSRTATSQLGVAWVKMNSAAKAGPSHLQATAANIREQRVIQQVPGNPCSIHMTARLSGRRIELETDPVRDCNGNPVPDGTIVTFTEAQDGRQSTIDVPLKRGVARTELPAEPGAVISVATGVILGNEIRWGGGSGK
jgi:hypothetical protein